ncbi:hypothetical protein B0H13DRAFT_2042505 [Mycena leptocephala]|nr:hypothetical protein B0H13DRAFT_2042505 [Mycena leptocephala]
MSLFSNSSGFIIQSGNFYSAGGDVNIQNNQQLVIGRSETHLCDQGSTSSPSIAWDEHPEGSSSSGPVRSDRSWEVQRFLPYDNDARRRQVSPYPSQYPPRFDLWSGNQHKYPQVSSLPTMSTSFSTFLVPPRTSDAPSPRYSAANPPSLRFSPDTLTLPNFPYDTFSAPDNTQLSGIAEQAHSMDSQPSFPAPAQGTPSQNMYPSQHEPTTTIHNGTFIGGNVNNTVRHMYGESGLNILHRVSAAEAFHDPADSYDQPRCHPETRIEMQNKLWTWCINGEWLSGTDSHDTEPTILWVHGPAGAGKSAIMQTLSQRLENAGRLGGTFFFKRGHPTRGNAKVLFTTIALQLAVNSSHLEPRISRIVEKNPTLVGRSIGVQLRELILKPCLNLTSPPRIIIVDGLDECEGQNVQQDILRLLRDFTQHRTPLRFVIASRPEAHIHEVFNELSFRGLYRAFNVESSFEDIRNYLVAEFTRIHRDHPTMATVPAPWPSKDVLTHLVDKSSGYFIYASTVVKFVDDKNYRPSKRLEAITNISGTGSKSPFSALDELYCQILSAVPDNHHLVPILRVIEYFIYPPGLEQIDELLGLEDGETELSLRSLHSVLKFWGRGDPTFIHASFSDFLCDPSRAGSFYIGDPVGLADLARLVLTELGYMYQDPIKNGRKYPVAFWLIDNLPNLLLRVEPSEELFHLLKAINCDFIDRSENIETIVSCMKVRNCPWPRYI